MPHRADIELARQHLPEIGHGRYNFRAMRPNLADLQLAERHIKEGEERIVEQLERIEHMAAMGQPTDEEVVILELMRKALEGMRHHRDHIAKDIKSG